MPAVGYRSWHVGPYDGIINQFNFPIEPEVGDTTFSIFDAEELGQAVKNFPFGI